jgi:hypothetical protein
MRSRIEEGLQDGGFGFSRFYVVDRGCLTDPETRGDYAEVLAAWPDIDWKEHPYWQLFYDDTAPAGFDTVREVYTALCCA